MINAGASTRLAVRPSSLETALAWLQRLVAVYCLAAGIFYWVRLLGFQEGALWRFDLMPVHWQVASVTLAVLYPFAAIGLWMLSSWGPVIWLICAAAEAAMYAGWHHLFGVQLIPVTVHAVVAVSYLALIIVISRQKRRVDVRSH